MYEGLTPHDSFADDSDFERVEERFVISNGIPPFYHNGIEIRPTPANAAVRMFFDPKLEDYSRVIIYFDDEAPAPFKPDDEYMQACVRGGVPVELPDELDETDKEFMDGCMRVWTEDVNAELERLS